MAENSRFWNGVTIGDATESPYDAPTEFGKVLGSIIGAEGLSNKGSVLQAIGNELKPTIVGATVVIAAGEAWVCRGWYENTAAVAVAIPVPVAATRIDRIVLRKDWTAQTIRITKIAGVEGGAAPAITQNVGVVWDLPLARVSTTTAGVMTLTDERPTPYLAMVMAMNHYHTGAAGDGPRLTGWNALADISATGGANKVLGTDADGRSQVEDPDSGKDIVNYQTIEDFADADTNYNAAVVGLDDWTLAVQKTITITRTCNILVIGTVYCYGGNPGGTVYVLIQMDATLGEERPNALINGTSQTVTIHMFFADVPAGTHTFNLMVAPTQVTMYASKGRISILAVPAL